jgi:hypothetical protein
MVWWGWMVIGALLLAAELFVIEAEFVLVFIGVAAILTGLLALTMPDVPNWAQWLVFSGLALVSMLLFRKRVYGLLRREVADLPNDMQREEFPLPVGLPAGGTCRVELRGSTWTARNAGPAAIPPGAMVRVVGVDGITLRVEACD